VKESTTYQAILEEGRQEGHLAEVREDICLVGEQKFNSPVPTSVRTTLAGIRDLEQLQQLLPRILDVASWGELMATLAPPKKAKSTGQ
jgi:hypothetical protein